MKSILLSIKPEWAAKILNGEKTIEIRKKFPKDYKGWVYLYITKRSPYIWQGAAKPMHTKELTNPFNFIWSLKERDSYSFGGYNGKVIGRFWCDNVDEITNKWLEWNTYETKYLWFLKLCEKSCLKDLELHNYLNLKRGYAISINALETFVKPKELSEFNINKAPQNYCYIKEEILRYLCVWDCQKGLPSNEPYKIPFEYQENDYFVISNVGKVNYKPCGKEYNGKKSEILEKNKISDGVYYVFDGSEWILNGGNIYNEKNYWSYLE